jgi:hypothetical protein
MRKNPLDFCKKVEKKLRNRYKNKKIILTTIVLIIMGCFFYSETDDLLFGNLKTNQLSVVDKDLTKKIAENLDLKENNGLVLGEIEEDIITPEMLAKNNLEEEIKNITKNHPIEDMAPFIATYDKKIAALIVGIAKKESDWGFHSPSKNGQTCYNYWGYKGQGSRGMALGYSCFGTPEEAVKAIGGRIKTLVNKRIDTPQKMVVWKCGSSCAGHDPAGVSKWISDVSIYYNRINKLAS